MKKAIIIGSGPAGLTAAYELLKHSTDITPIVFELSNGHGGISRTVTYRDNKIDIGGHRFFSKSDTIINWWTDILPIQHIEDQNQAIALNYQNKSRKLDLSRQGPNPETEDNVMLVRNRKSRILFAGKLFNYPLSFDFETLKNLGLWRLIKILASYSKSHLFPIQPERSLEDFFINRFGKELYLTFFKEYTEKVWGQSCTVLSAEWGRQRIKGLSLMKALRDLGSRMLPIKNTASKKTETSLIQHFLYPKYGPGHMWEQVAKKVSEKGGIFFLNTRVKNIVLENNKIIAIDVEDTLTKETRREYGDFFFSTMPIKELLNNCEGTVPAEIKEVAQGLIYRDFITVGLLLNKMKVKADDTWMYIQEPGLKVGRLQIFNNWSPYLVKDPTKTWIGMEYFSNEGDDFWKQSDAEIASFAAQELQKINLVDEGDVLDSTVIRQLKAYPTYTGAYSQFKEIRAYLNTIENLFPIGRNGMHKYNNQDHSMLTAMAAVDVAIKGSKDKDHIWDINAEQEYHE